MVIPLRLAGLAVLLGLVTQGHCAAGDICYILGAVSTLIQDRLYFLQGYYSFVTPNGQSIEPTSSLYSVKVDDTFPIERSIPSSLVTSTDIGSAVHVAQTDPFNASVPMWSSGDTLYVFGGPSSPTNVLPSYNVTSQTWQDVQVEGGSFNFGNHSFSQAVSTPDSGLSFYSGGLAPYTGPSMVRFDASNPAKLSWTNESLDHGSYGSEVPNLLDGTIVYVPAGNAGLLISFGGYNVSEGIDSNSGFPYPSDFCVINASGVIPPTYLCQFCAGVTSSPDNTAFHITIYGGWSLLELTSYETVYTLTLPSFTWINATSISAQSNAEQQVNSTIGRDQQSCQVYNKTQLLVLGGNIRAGHQSLTNGACNQVFAPLRALDLSTYTWQSVFDPSLEYKVPDTIYSVIGGSATGGATKTTPDSGWAETKLSAAMKQRPPTATASSRSSSSSSSTATSTSGSKATSAADPSTAGYSNVAKSHTSATAGGVAGGIVALALIALLVWFILRSRKRKSRGNARAAADWQSDNSKTPFEAENTHLRELHGDHRPHEVDATQVYELPDKSYQGAELPAHGDEEKPSS
nr:hypothetical protein B0A51_09187 [Rachicladosporium sp. CCFEE 5018]